MQWHTEEASKNEGGNPVTESIQTLLKLWIENFSKLLSEDGNEISKGIDKPEPANE